MEAPFGIVTAVSDHPNPVFNSYLSSQSLSSISSSQVNFQGNSPNFSCLILNQSNPIETTLIGTQIEAETWNDKTDSQLTSSLWNTEFTTAKFQQQNRSLSIELNNPKVSLRCANHSQANAKADVNHVVSKLKISEPFTFDLFEENKEVKQQLDEATSKAESLQTELLEANKTNILLKQNLGMTSPTKVFKNPWKKTTEIKNQNEMEKLVKQPQTMQVEIDIQDAEAIQLIQAVDGKQYEKLEKCLHAHLTHVNHWDWKILRKILNFQRQTWKY